MLSSNTKKTNIKINTFLKPCDMKLSDYLKPRAIDI